MPGSARFKALLDEAWALHQEKSSEYGSKSDPLANIRAQAAMGYKLYDGCIIELGNIQRRIDNLMLAQHEGRVKDQAKWARSMRNALMDNAAFSYLAIIMLEEDGALTVAVLEAAQEAVNPDRPRDGETWQAFRRRLGPDRYAAYCADLGNVYAGAGVFDRT